ncbi:tetratricopeptide (TPR) repeat protein [Kitasatospora sp. GP30]|nr:tetratricopeptide (TPR) repeat protein [Kitasatospora sp. GP30]
MVHSLSCSREIRRRAVVEEWGVERIVEAIAACCGISRLRAHRLGRGWTLTEAISELRVLCRATGLSAPGTNEEQLRAWETSARQPRARTVDLLCRLYATDPAGLGLIGDYRPEDRPAAPATADSCLPPCPPPVTAAPPPAGDAIEVVVDAVRRSVERTLALTTVSATQLEVLDERLLGLRQAYVYTPPTEMLAQLLGDLEEIRTLAEERQPAGVQVRLSEMTALVATLVADALMKLGRVQQAQRWYGTARTAADDSGNCELRARVRAQAAMLPYYYGPLDSAVDLARQARLLNRNRPTATGVLAAAAEARALARRGSADEARAAIRQAQDLFERCRHGQVDDAWAFPERRLYLYLSGTYTYLGAAAQARAAQQQALRLYPGQAGIDPALLRLEEAICLAQERSLAEACELASHTYLQVPAAHRTDILGSRANDVIEMVPQQFRSVRVVRELGEILMLPAGTR